MPDNKHDDAMDHQNPWENAAIDRAWAEESLRFDNNKNENNNNAELHNNDDDEELASKLVRYLIHFLHFCDFISGSTFFLFGVITRHNTSQHGGAASLWCVIIVGGLVLLRSILGTLSVLKSSHYRLGMSFSALLSIFLALFLFVTSMLTLGNPYGAIHVLQRDLHVKVMDFYQRHVFILWTAQLVLSVIEIFRWALIRNYRLYLLECDDLALQLSMPLRTRRPWWWKNNNDTTMATNSLTDPLVGGGNNERKKASFFGWLRQQDYDLRDDGSVDFQSVQEDWASRSEEDPLWWAKDEHGENVTTRAPSTGK